MSWLNHKEIKIGENLGVGGELCGYKSRVDKRLGGKICFERRPRGDWAISLSRKNVVTAYIKRDGREYSIGAAGPDIVSSYLVETGRLRGTGIDLYDVVLRAVEAGYVPDDEDAQILRSLTKVDEKLMIYMLMPEENGVPSWRIKQLAGNQVKAEMGQGLIMSPFGNITMESDYVLTGALPGLKAEFEVRVGENGVGVMVAGVERSRIEVSRTVSAEKLELIASGEYKGSFKQIEDEFKKVSPQFKLTKNV